MKKIALLFILQINCLPVYSQNDLVNFSGKQVEDYIFISFTLTAGITCNGLVIERSADTIEFEEVYTIPGICGSASSEETYTFNDYKPLQKGINYYRLNLGNAGYSKSIAVSYFIYDENGIVVFPNPIMDNGAIYFSNPKKVNYSFLLFNQNGLSLKLENNTGEKIEFNRQQFSNGIYFYELIDEKERKVKAKGKIIFL